MHLAARRCAPSPKPPPAFVFSNCCFLQSIFSRPNTKTQRNKTQEKENTKCKDPQCISLRRCALSAEPPQFFYGQLISKLIINIRKKNRRTNHQMQSRPVHPSPKFPNLPLVSFPGQLFSRRKTKEPKSKILKTQFIWRGGRIPS